jgi:hypothetical protein
MNTYRRYDEDLARVSGRFQSTEKRRKLPQFENSRCKNKRKEIYFYMCKQF